MAATVLMESIRDVDDENVFDLLFDCGFVEVLIVTLVLAVDGVGGGGWEDTE